MVLTFFSMNQVIFALLYCSSFQHCVQIKEKMPREHSGWILSPPPFTLQGQHLLPNASLKFSHKGKPEQIRQPTTLQGLSMLRWQGHLFIWPSRSWRFARHRSAHWTSPQQTEEGGVVGSCRNF